MTNELINLPAIYVGFFFGLYTFIYNGAILISASFWGIAVKSCTNFYGKSIYKYKAAGAEYTLGWIPWGSSVKLAGLMEEDDDTQYDEDAFLPEDIKFRSKPFFARYMCVSGFSTIILSLMFIVFIALSFDGSFKENVTMLSLCLSNIYEYMMDELVDAEFFKHWEKMAPHANIYFLSGSIFLLYTIPNQILLSLGFFWKTFNKIFMIVSMLFILAALYFILYKLFFRYNGFLGFLLIFINLVAATFLTGSFLYFIQYFINYSKRDPN
jgi:hypothetical protein